MPKHIRDKRERESRKRQKERRSSGFAEFLVGHWLDSLGHSILVAKAAAPEANGSNGGLNGEATAAFTAVLTPMVDHPNAKDRVLGEG
eukprot:Skav229411  [mRNA]  locus=scaffold2297:83576:85968:+ [translate_table: standard]